MKEGSERQTCCCWKGAMSGWIVQTTASRRRDEGTVVCLWCVFLVSDKDEDEGSELRSEVKLLIVCVYGCVESKQTLLQGDGPLCGDKKTSRAVVSGGFQGCLGPGLGVGLGLGLGFR